MTPRSKRIRVSISEDQYDKLCRLATQADLELATETYLLLAHAIRIAWARWEQLQAAFERGTSHDGGLEAEIRAAAPGLPYDDVEAVAAIIQVVEAAAPEGLDDRPHEARLRDGPQIVPPDW